MTPRIENFALIIGAMLSGTGRLYDRLGSHPAIARNQGRELNFFSKAAAWEKGADHYRGLWPGFDPARHAIALEASADYAKLPRSAAVPPRIARFITETGARFRFLYLVSDPVARIEAHFANSLARGRLEPDDAEARSEALRWALAVSRYADQLDGFRAPLGNPEVLLLDAAAFARDPRPELVRAATFLEVDPSGFPAAAFEAIVEPAPKHGAGLTEAERQLLRGALHEDVTRLRDAYGFDVAGWGFPDRAALPPAEEIAAAGLATPAAPPRTPAAKGKTKAAGGGYWRRRRDMMYYKYVLALASRLSQKSKSLIDVGSHSTSIAEEFRWIPKRVALDISHPYSSQNVTGIEADFLTFKPETRFDFALCLQVLEHIPDVERFARKLLEVADRVLVSVPYQWPAGSHRQHVHDPVDEAKLAGWFGRMPDYQIVVEEPFLPGVGVGKRLIAYFHAPDETFDPKNYRGRTKVKRGKGSAAKGKAKDTAATSAAPQALPAEPVGV